MTANATQDRGVDQPAVLLGSRRRRRTPRRLPLKALMALAISAGSLASTGGAAVHASPLPRSGCELRACAVPMYTKGFSLSSISCPSATVCVAVGTEGSYTGAIPVVATESAGVWRAELLPSSTSVNDTFSSVSCTSATSCTAAGYNTPPEVTDVVPVIGVEQAGGWELTDQGSETGDVLLGVSCALSKDCTAVGIEAAPGENYIPIAETESAGTWGAVSESPASNLGSEFAGVSCLSATSCTAVGGDGYEPTYATGIAGTFGAMKEISAPAGSTFLAVSCRSMTDCTAVGEESSGRPADDGEGEPFYATESNGVWGPAEAIGVPGGIGAFDAVSCTSALDCTAVGGTRGGTGAARQPIYAVETNGVWGKATEIVSPEGGSLSGVSCTSPRHCTAVGIDSRGYPIYPTETDGTWPRVPRAPKLGRVTPGDKSITVTWAPPKVDGGAPVTSYTASAVSGTRTFTCTSPRSCTIRGLAAGTTYTVSVVARNAAGSSASSAKRSATPHA